MKTLAAVVLAALIAGCTSSGERPATAARPAPDVAAAQVPAWSADDLTFFLHGSTSGPPSPSEASTLRPIGDWVLPSQCTNRRSARSHTMPYFTGE